MSLHKSLSGSQLHAIYALTYADATARTTAAGLTIADNGKVALQSDNKSYWVLQDYTGPTWSQINGGGGSGLNQLTGDVTAGPGTGSQPATVEKIQGTSVTGVTGTGNVVLDDTPTLITPDIGAATGTSLNLSGLSASAAVITDGSSNLATYPYTSLDTGNTLVSRDSNGNFAGNAVVTSVYTIPTSDQTIGMNNGYAQTQRATGSATINYVLPDATTLMPFASYNINNESSDVANIYANDGTTLIGVVPGGGYGIVATLDTSTANGAWDLKVLGGISGLSPSQAVVTDSGNNISSLPYSASSSASSIVSRDGQANSALNSLFIGTTITVTANQTVTMDNTYAQVQVSNGSLNILYNLPDATTLPVGAIYRFTNNGTGSSTVNLNNGSILVDSVPADGSVDVTLLDNGDANGVWDFHFSLGKGAFSGSSGTFIPGSINIPGSSSGLVSIIPQAAAGTYNFNLPITAGTAGQVLTSQGGGSSAMTWTSGGGGGGGTPGGSITDIQLNDGSGGFTAGSGNDFSYNPTDGTFIAAAAHSLTGTVYFSQMFGENTIIDPITYGDNANYTEAVHMSGKNLTAGQYGEQAWGYVSNILGQGNAGNSSITLELDEATLGSNPVLKIGGSIAPLGSEYVKIPPGFTYIMNIKIVAVETDFSVCRWDLTATAQNTGAGAAGVGSVWCPDPNFVHALTDFTWGDGSHPMGALIPASGPGAEDSSARAELQIIPGANTFQIFVTTTDQTSPRIYASVEITKVFQNSAASNS